MRAVFDTQLHVTMNQLKRFLNDKQHRIKSTWCLPKEVSVKPSSVSVQSGIVSDTKEFSKNDVCSNAVTEDTFLETNDGDSIYKQTIKPPL